MPREAQDQVGPLPPWGHGNKPSAKLAGASERLVAHGAKRTHGLDIGALPLWNLVSVLGEIALRLECRQPGEVEADSSQVGCTSRTRQEEGE